MAIAYLSQGAGVSTQTSGAALSPLCPATVTAGDVLIAHVFWEGTSDAPSTPGGWTMLGSSPYVIQSTIARHWVFGRIADGTEDGAAVAFGSPASTNQRGARIYSFSGRTSGTITDLCGGFSHQSHATDPQMPTVTTERAGALAVALVGQNDNNTAASATGESGGNWTEQVAEYVAALTPGLMMQIQACIPTSDPGTVSGGTVATANDPCGVIGFYIRPDANVNVTPATATLALTGYAPTVQAPRVCIPGIAALVLAAFAPTVTAGINVTPGVAALAIATFAPTVLTPRVVTPGPVGGGEWPTGRTLHLDFADLGSLTLTGALIDQVNDLSGNSRHFTATGTDRPTSASDPTIGQAAVFDATSTNVMTTTATWADLTSPSAWTIAIRCTFASVASTQANTYGDGLLFLYGSSGGAFARQDGSGGYLVYAVNNDAAAGDQEASVVLTLDTEVLLIGRHTGGNVEARDGIGTPTSTPSGDSTPAAQTWRLGIAAGGGNFLTGAIGQVLVWDRALTEGEISTVLGKLQGTAGPALTSYAPTVVIGTVVTPATASLTLTGYAPTVTGGGGGSVSVTPPAASLVLTGYAPTVLVPRVCAPGAAALSLTGYAPTVLAPRVCAPATATLALTGYAPTVLAPRVVVPTTASLALAGFAPTAVATAHVTVTPAIATLALSAFAPTVTAGASISVTPPTAALTLAGFAPTVLVPRVVVPSTAALSLTGYAPTVTAASGLTVIPGTAALTLTGFAPTVLTPRVVTPPVGALSLTGFVPTVTTWMVVTPTTAALTLTRYAPDVAATETPHRPRASVVPAWARDGLKDSLPSGFWRRWL